MVHRVTIPRYDGAPILGLPEHAITITNSERQTAACRLRWWFRHAEGLERPPGRALRFGAAWDSLIEDIQAWYAAKDESYPSDGTWCIWCQKPDSAAPPRSAPACTRCGGSRLGPLTQAYQEACAARDRYPDTYGDFSPEELQDVLHRCFEGYFLRYGASPPETLRYVATQVQLAAPILNPQGTPFKPETIILPADPAGMRWRLARTGEAHHPDARTIRWPWYQLGKLDALACQRSTQALWTIENKTSGSPTNYLEGLSVDPQIAGYGRLVQHASTQGLFPWVAQGTLVAGYLYDVVSSRKHADPQVLKSGKLSRNKRVNVPSWRYLRAILGRGENPMEPEYRSLLDHFQQTVDPKLYVREWGSIGPEMILRYEREIYVIARQISTMRRRAAKARDAFDILNGFPRTPVCRQPGGWCSYRGPCLADGDEVRKGFLIDGVPVDQTTRPEDREEPWF